MSIQDKEILIGELEEHLRQVIDATMKHSPFSMLTDNNLRDGGMRLHWTNHRIKNGIVQTKNFHRKDFLKIVEESVLNPDENLERWLWKRSR